MYELEGTLWQGLFWTFGLPMKCQLCMLMTVGM